jgi:hypothetical protein
MCVLFKSTLNCQDHSASWQMNEEVWKFARMIMTGTKQGRYKKPYPTTTLSTKYLTWIDTGLNLVLHNERMQTKLLQNTWENSDNSVV